MSWGDPERGGHPWVKDEAFAEETIRAALEAGINFFDTANVYSGGRARSSPAARCGSTPGARRSCWPPRSTAGCGRPQRRRAVAARDPPRDRRLARAPGTDHVDLYQIHRWDPAVPIEETMEALHDVVRSGKARYIGASSMYAWQFAKAQEVARSHGWTEFVSMQDHYNLIYREEEREMLPSARPGRRRHPVEPAGARPPDPAVGHRTNPHRDRRVRWLSTATRTPRSCRPCSTWPASAASPRPRSRWPGCWPSPS